MPPAVKQCVTSVGFPYLSQRSSSFAAPHVNFDAGVFHAFELGDKLACPFFKSWIFEHAKHAIVKCHGSPSTCLFDELAHLLGEQFAGLRAHVELLILRANRFQSRPSLRIKSTGRMNSIPFFAPLLDHLLGLVDAQALDVIRLILMGRIFGDTQRKVLALQLRGGLLQRHGQ